MSIANTLATINPWNNSKIICTQKTQDISQKVTLAVACIELTKNAESSGFIYCDFKRVHYVILGYSGKIFPPLLEIGVFIFGVSY